MSPAPTNPRGRCRRAAITRPTAGLSVGLCRFAGHVVFRCSECGPASVGGLASRLLEFQPVRRRRIEFGRWGAVRRAETGSQGKPLPESGLPIQRDLKLAAVRRERNVVIGAVGDADMVATRFKECQARAAAQKRRRHEKFERSSLPHSTHTPRRQTGGYLVGIKGLSQFRPDRRIRADKSLWVPFGPVLVCRTFRGARNAQDHRLHPCL